RRGSQRKEQKGRGRRNVGRDPRRLSFFSSSLKSRASSLFQLLHLHAAVADELLGVVAAAVNLDRDAAAGPATIGVVLPFHEFHVVDPGGDFRRVADDAGAELMPLAMLPKLGPGFGRDRQRRG